MTDFLDEQFPTSISRGSSGGPTRITDVVILRSGHERRNSIWAESKRKYDAGLGIRNLDDVYEAMEFFENTEGRLLGFRWKDWLDYKSCLPSSEISGEDQVQDKFSVPEDQVFQLVKTYSTASRSFKRDITKPINGTVSVLLNGEPMNGFMDYATGEFCIPFLVGEEDTVTAGFEFDVPVRFDQDEFIVNVELFNVGEVPALKTVEVFPKKKEFLYGFLIPFLRIANNFDFMNISDRVNIAVNIEWSASE